MDTNRTHHDERYEGPPKTIEALGKSSAYGWIGAAIGGTVGAIFSGSFIKEEHKITKSVSELVEKLQLPIKGKTTLMIASAYVVGMVAHYAGMAIGLRKGLREAGRGEAQFERLKSERNQAEDERDAALARAGTAEAGLQEIAEKLAEKKNATQVPAEPGKHVAAHTAKKEAAEQMELAR